MSGTITMTGEEYDALRAEAEALRAENGRLQADRDRANQYANQQALECNKLSTDLEAARGLLESAVVLFACHCTDATAKNWHDAAAAFLTATPAPEVPDHTERNLEMVEREVDQNDHHNCMGVPIAAICCGSVPDNQE